MSEVSEYAGAAAQEDFRAFLDDQEQEWGDDGLEADVLDGLEDESFDEGEEESYAARPQRRQGTDEVVSRLRRSDPEAARIVSDMQRKMHQNINEWNELRSEVLGLREQLLAQREGQVGSAQAEQQINERVLPEGVTDQHLEMFKSMADHLGYLPRQELEGREAEARSQRYINENLAQAYEMFGDEFGYQDESGNIQLHPEVQERLNRRLEELQDPTRGITPLDLYRLEFGGEAPPPRRSPQQQRRPERRQQQQVRRPSPSATVRRSSRGNVPVRIYDPKRGDSAEDVFDRAWALGKRQLTGQ